MEKQPKAPRVAELKQPKAPPVKATVQHGKKIAKKDKSREVLVMIKRQAKSLMKDAELGKLVRLVLR